MVTLMILNNALAITEGILFTQDKDSTPSTNSYVSLIISMRLSLRTSLLIPEESDSLYAHKKSASVFLSISFCKQKSVDWGTFKQTSQQTGVWVTGESKYFERSSLLHNVAYKNLSRTVICVSVLLYSILASHCSPPRPAVPISWVYAKKKREKSCKSAFQ